MAILSFHVILTFIAASIYRKYIERYSTWIFDRIFRGLHYYLMQSALIPVGPEKRQKKRRKGSADPNSSDGQMKLIQLPINANLFENIPYFESLVRAINYFVFAVIVYVISDVFNLFFSDYQGVNTSLIWVACSLIYQVLILVKLAYVSEERNILFTSATAMFLISFVMSLFSKSFLTVNFDKDELINLTHSVNEFLKSKGLNELEFDARDGFSLIFFVVFSLVFSVIGSSFLFPIFQYASLYTDIAQQCISPIERLFHHVIFFSPSVIFLSFIKPVSDFLIDDVKICSMQSYRVIQLLAILSWTLVRILTAKFYLQKFLDRPLERMSEFKEMKEDQCRRRVTYYASYFCAASLQYFLPVSITFLAALMLKTLGSIQFLQLWNHVEMANRSDLQNNLISNILLSPAIHRPLWSLFLVVLLGIHSLLSIIGTIGKGTFIHGV